MKSTLLVPFGLKENQLYEANQVPNGKACGCVCPACKKPLVARQNAKTPHFAHHQDDNCSKGLETAVHLAVKQVIAERMKIRLPAVIWTNPLPRTQESKKIYVERIIELESVVLEQVIDDIKPDLVVIANNTKYLIEVAVTHFIDEIKQQKINKKMISTFEIDVSALKTNFTLAGLEKALFENGDYQAKWKYHPRLEQLDHEAKQAEEQRITEIRMIELERLNKFERYRNLPPYKKLEINLKSIGLTKKQMNALSTFVPWDNSFGTPRIIWQSAVLAYISKVQEEYELDDFLTSTINTSDCLDWLEAVFEINTTVHDGEKIALWKYFQYLEKKGILKRWQHKDFELISPKSKWGILADS